MSLTVKDDNNPAGDITIVFQGLRPGEKLYEELLIGEDVTGTEHPKIMRANEKSFSANVIHELVERSLRGISKQDSEVLIALLSEVVDGFEVQATSDSKSLLSAPLSTLQ